MTGNNYLLDTNIITAWLKEDTKVADKIDRSDGIFIPIIVIGELYYGASFSKNVRKNINNTKKVIASYTTLTLDEESTTIYGKIKAILRKNGTPIPENDIWIAAIAIQNNIPLVTRDKHFKNIDGIKLEEW